MFSLCLLTLFVREKTTRGILEFINQDKINQSYGIAKYLDLLKNHSKDQTTVYCTVTQTSHTVVNVKRGTAV